MEEVSRLFPSYEIHVLIACGGMGAVYQATQRSLDRMVAIKILPREFSTDEAFRAGFESEAKAMAKLNHPNLISVYDFGEADGMLFIIMEYVVGKSLFHSANGLAVDQSKTLSIVADICRGLAHAHENGILHRDIKPSNILLDANAHPKIGDFGLARALEREIQEGEQIFGTPGYTAPEVLEPPFSIDQRADIYSVGVMLHELLTGKLPDADSRPASQICGCTQRLDAVILRALHSNPNFRYRSASELADDLEQISNTPSRALLTSAKPPSGARALATPGKALSARPALSSAKPKPGPAALGSPSVLPGSSALPSAKPPSEELVPDSLRALSARPALRAPKPLTGRSGTYTSQKEGSFGLWLLLGLLVVIVIVTIMVLNKKTPPQENATIPPEAEQLPVLPEDDGSAADSKIDPADALRNARTSISHRVGPRVESHKRDLKSNLLAFETALTELASARFESGLKQIFAEWKAAGDRIPPVLPRDIANAEGARELLSQYLGKQKSLDETLAAEMKSQSGIYVLELQNQIEQLTKSGDEAAIDALEEEVRRVNDSPDYFSSIMGR